MADDKDPLDPNYVKPKKLEPFDIRMGQMSKSFEVLRSVAPIQKDGSPGFELEGREVASRSAALMHSLNQFQPAFDDGAKSVFDRPVGKILEGAKTYSDQVAAEKKQELLKESGQRDITKVDIISTAFGVVDLKNKDNAALAASLRKRLGLAENAEVAVYLSHQESTTQKGGKFMRDRYLIVADDEKAKNTKIEDRKPIGLLELASESKGDKKYLGTTLVMKPNVSEVIYADENKKKTSARVEFLPDGSMKSVTTDAAGKETPKDYTPAQLVADKEAKDAIWKLEEEKRKKEGKDPLDPSAKATYSIQDFVNGANKAALVYNMDPATIGVRSIKDALPKLVDNSKGIAL